MPKDSVASDVKRIIKSVDSLAIQVAKNTSDISSLKVGQMSLEQKMDGLEQKVDSNTGILIRMERKIDEALAVSAESTQPRVKKCEERLDGHDRRLGELEKTS